jgi:hypothetical protein
LLGRDVPGGDDDGQEQEVPEERKRLVGQTPVDRKSVGRETIEDATGWDRIYPAQGGPEDGMCHALEELRGGLQADKEYGQDPDHLNQENDKFDDNVGGQPCG